MVVVHRDVRKRGVPVEVERASPGAVSTGGVGGEGPVEGEGRVRHLDSAAQVDAAPVDGGAGAGGLGQRVRHGGLVHLPVVAALVEDGAAVDVAGPAAHLAGRVANGDLGQGGC